MSNSVYIRRRKKVNKSKTKRFMENFEAWVAYWRANPQRFITEYLGLKLYDFQKVLIYMMFMYPSFIFAASRGLNYAGLSGKIGRSRETMIPR